VTEVGLGIVVGEAEDHEQALAHLVGPLHGIFEGVVLLGALGGLHPVQHVVAIPHNFPVQILYALFSYSPRRQLCLPPDLSPDGKIRRSCRRRVDLKTQNLALRRRSWRMTEDDGKTFRLEIVKGGG
jgi:hypothetical protein